MNFIIFAILYDQFIYLFSKYLLYIFFILLTCWYVGWAQAGIDLGGKEVDDGHGGEHVDDAQDAAAQRHNDDGRVEDEVSQGPHRHCTQLRHLEYIVQYVHSHKNLVLKIILNNAEAVQSPPRSYTKRIQCYSRLDKFHTKNMIHYSMSTKSCKMFDSGYAVCDAHRGD